VFLELGTLIEEGPTRTISTSPNDLAVLGQRLLEMSERAESLTEGTLVRHRYDERQSST
jgi:hypothetical protein